MNSSQRLRLLAVSLVTAAVASISGPAVAATATVGPPTRGGHETTNRCYSDAGPTTYNRISGHARDRMAERGVSEAEVAAAVRIGAGKAFCQSNGKWRYTVGMANGQLVVIVGLGEGGWNVVTVFWKGEDED
ncbi:DUF4258 domain-containing protein [Streptomyces netropsis]|uniref:DUF4258 domain-containing protein n=1 Tax=Streptomyces netropsis TaxID=55404 RepID=A0A7W7PAZ5_STRNE|nr:DUF4258 domain-containing protein [Streptomyces netropsis]MBB4884076.1 hypothetical protein [Streptomyces netropsis]GGR06264.1 hypothetical protein GCM10010219_08410 [Streptomyces netropsis]